jgi:hypothetical protein
MTDHRAGQAPTLTNITRRDDVVGEYTYSAEVTHPGQPTDVVEIHHRNVRQHVLSTDDHQRPHDLVSEAWRHGTPL